MSWLRDHISEAILGGVAVIILGGGATIWAMNGRLSALEAHSEDQGRRIDNMAASLPSLQVRLAYETIHENFPTAVLFTAKTQNDGTTEMTAHVWNNAEQQMSAYRYVVTESERLRTELALVGSVQSADPRAVSLKVVEQMGIDTQEPVPIPNTVIKDKSFLVYEPANDITARLKALGFAQAWQKDTPSVSNWVNASKLLNVDGSLLSPPP